MQQSVSSSKGCQGFGDWPSHVHPWWCSNWMGWPFLTVILKHTWSLGVGTDLKAAGVVWLMCAVPAVVADRQWQVVVVGGDSNIWVRSCWIGRNAQNDTWELATGGSGWLFPTIAYILEGTCGQWISFCRGRVLYFWIGNVDCSNCFFDITKENDC